MSLSCVLPDHLGGGSGFPARQSLTFTTIKNTIVNDNGIIL